MAFQVLTAAVFVAQAIGTATSAVLVAAASAGAAGLAAAASLASIAYTSYATKKAEADARKNAAQAPRDITVRSATEPAKIIYGKARTSGPVVYTNTAPTPGTNDNNTLWTVISLCSHEVEDITDIWLDGDEITASQINWGGTGGVTSGKYGPIGANEVTNFYKRLGTSTQAHVSELATAFNDWTSSYQGKNVAYIVSAFELGTATGEGVWAQGAPTNIRAVVKGKKVYDPRKDSTNGGSGAHRLADSTTWEWSDNPALCLADYLFDDRLGLGAEGVTYDDIDWPLVIAAANVCDATVSIPGGTTEKRFTCNGALSTGNTYAENIKAILSSMDGQITWSGGKYRIRACAYEAPVYTFTGDDVVGDVQIQPERTRAQRFNTVRGTFVDPESDYVATEFIPYTDSNLQSGRDAGQKLTKDIALPMTNSEYMAQRLAYKIVALNDQQLRCIVPMNWKALKVGVGDRIQLSIDELSWSNKVFRVEGWAFDPDAGFNLTLQEDSSSSYADPGVSDYSTRTLAGTVVFADQPVPSPSNLSATAEEEAVFLQWSNPGRASGYDEIIIYASANSSWASASEVARTRGNSFRHELARGTQRYYWIRAVDVDGETSIRNPNSDTSSITATAGQIDFANLGGATKPADNATRNTGALADKDTVAEADIDNGAVTIDKFGTGLEPIQVVSSLPASATAGQMAFLTTDNKLYRYNGTAWTAAIPVGDVSGAGDLAALDTITLSYVTDAGDVAALDSISETYIDDSSITTAKINANAVTAAKIQANTITAAQIAANTITANEIAANTLTANEIASNTITANQIAANTITAGQIAAGTITATEIASSTITADEIASGAIVTSKLAVTGRGAALNSDPNCQDSSAWEKFAGSDATFTTITDGEVGNNVMRSAAGTTWYNGGEALALDPSKTYRMTALVRKNATANGTLYVGVAAFTADGTNIQGDGSQWSYDAASSSSGSTSWTRYTMEFGAGTAQTFPSNAVTFKPIVLMNYGGSAGYFEAQDVRIEEKSGADLIVDGAITTDKIAANAIYGSKINSGTTIVAGSGTNTAALSGVYDYRFWAGGETPAINLPFLVHKDGTVYARKMVLKDSAGNELFNSETGFTNLSINQIVTGTGSTAIKVTTYSEAFTDNNGEVEITLSQTSDLKVGIKIDASWDGSDINASQTTAETNAVADIPSQVQLGVGYASSSGGTFVSSSTGTFSRVTTLSGTPSDEYLVEVTSFYEPEVIPGGAYIASATVQTDEPTSAVGPFGYILYEYTFSSLPAGTYYFRTTASGTGGSGSNVVNSSYDRTIEITDLTTDGGFVVDGGGSQTVGQADITSVTAGTNLTGGGLSGGVTLNLADDISLSNITLSGYLRGPASFTIDPAAHGDDTGTVVIAGNLQVDGTTTTINSTTLTVDDKNIVLADGAANAAAADGAGITIDGANASLTYSSTNNRFNFSHNVNVPGSVTATSFSGLASHATNLNATDDRDIHPDGLSWSDDLRLFFAEKTAVEGGSAGSTYLDFLVLNSYTDNSGGDANALAFAKGSRAIYHYFADQSAGNWGTPKQLAYTDSNISGTAAGLSGSPSITVSGVTSTGTIQGNLIKAQSNNAAVVAINDSSAANDTDLVAYVSFQREGTERAWLGFGSDSSDVFRLSRSAGDIQLHPNGGNVNITTGGLEVGGVSVIDSSRGASFTGATISGITNTQQDIRSAGQIRATGWWNDAASTDYTGLAAEIGVSAGIAHVISYNRSSSAYGAMRFDATSFTFGNGVSVTGSVNATNLQVGGVSVIDSSRGITGTVMSINSASHAYLNINGASGYESGIIWKKGSANKWETYLPSGSDDLYFYSYTKPGQVLQLQSGGGAQLTGNMQITGKLQVTHESSGLLFEDVSGNATLWLDGVNGDFIGGDYFGIRAVGSDKLSFLYGSGEKAYISSAGDIYASTDLIAGSRLVGGIGARTTAGTADWNHASNARSGSGFTLLPGNATNGPTPGVADYWHPFTFEYYNKDGTGNMTQFAIPYASNDGSIYWRTRYSNSWTGWTKLWSDVNDGSGSGLDADKLDSYHQTDFVRLASSSSSSTNGNFAIGQASSRNFIQSHNSQPLDINPIGNDINFGSTDRSNTTVNIIAADDGRAELRLYGSSQGTGRVYVGQSTEYGGGIEYNGDGSPATTGSPDDTITLFRNAGGTIGWTAYNAYNDDHWIYKGDVRTRGQVRATGWWGSATSDQNGLAAEIGVSSGRAHLISYNRSSSAYGDLTISAPTIDLTYGSGSVTVKSGKMGIGLTDWDNTNIALDINGHTSIRRGHALFFGVNSTSVNSWEMKFWNSGSAAILNAQSFLFDNSGYGSEQFLRVDVNGAALGNYGTYSGGSSARTLAIHGNSSSTYTGFLSLARANSAKYYLYEENGNYKYQGQEAGVHQFIVSGTTVVSEISSDEILHRSATGGKLRAVSITDANNNASVGATWSSGGGYGMFMEYYPNTAIGYLQNNYNMSPGNVYGDIHIRQMSGGSWQTRLLFDNDQAKAVFQETLEVDSGTSSTFRVLCDNDGNATIEARGDGQGTGMVYVGQSSGYGGGIEYNGDGSPATTGAGGDYVALFRREGGTNSWTARNYYSSNDWEFRAAITAGGAITSGGDIKGGGLVSANNNKVMRAAIYSNSGYTHTGCYVIRLPGTTGNFSMPVIRITTYEYNSRAVNIYYVGGHNWSTTSYWYNQSVHHIGAQPRTVRLGNDGTSHCIVLGETTDTWDYESIVVDVLNHPTYYQTNQDFTGAWSIYRTTTMPSAVSGNIVRRQLQSGAGNNTYDAGASGSLYFGGNARFQANGTESIQHVNSYGNLEFGPLNSGGCHIYTDRARFYFNKRVVCLENHFSSYNDDLQLKRNESDTYKCYISTGGLVSTQNVTAYSDRRLKTDIEPITGALDTVMKLQGVKYTRIDSGNRDIGFIAQEIEEKCPEIADRIVNTADDEMGTKNLNYQNMVALLTEAIKTQQQQIEALTARIEELEHGDD